MVTPVKDLACIKVDQSANYVSDGPALAKVCMLNVPFLHTVPIVSIRVGAITYTIAVVEGSIDSAPADLHKAIRQ